MATKKRLMKLAGEIISLAEKHNVGETTTRGGFPTGLPAGSWAVATYYPKGVAGKLYVKASVKDFNKCNADGYHATHYLDTGKDLLVSQGPRGEKALEATLWALKAQILTKVRDDSRLLAVYVTAAMFIRKRATFAQLRAALS